MRFAIIRCLLVICILGLLTPAVSLAKAPHKYQVTGKVLEVSDDTIVVQKDEEKWEIARDAATKVDGKLTVGSKVTIHYYMTAASVEVKDDKAVDKKPAK